MSYRYGKAKVDSFIKNIRNKEVLLSSTKSSGSGGQHVNKNETKVQLYRDVIQSEVFPHNFKQKLRERNSHCITDSGVLRIDTSVHKSQKANKEQTYKKFVKVIKSAFKEEVIRKKSVVPQRVVDRRIAEKKKRSKRRATRTKIVG